MALRRALAAVAGLLALGAFGPGSGGFAAPPSAEAASNRGAQAVGLLADLIAGRDHAIVATLDAQMAAALTPARLAQALASYEAQFGSYLGHGAPTVVAVDGETVVRIPLRMSRLPGEFRLAFNHDGRVSGLYLLRTGVPL
jgi:hypothetical protein